MTPSPFTRYHAIVDDAHAFEASLQQPLARFVWTNTLRTTAGRLKEALQCDGYAPQPLPWHPTAFRITGRQQGLGRHWTYLAGFFQIQEASSMLPVLLLNPQPSERILDLCAAPGNKTVQLAVALNNHGTVVGNDLVGARLRALGNHVERLGLLNVSITCHDGASYPKRAGHFDAVLVDAPCSCEGTSRKLPAVIERPAAGAQRQVQKQFRLLDQAVRRCRPGGRVLYSTCTYAPEENEAVVQRALEAWPGQLRIVPAGLPGLRAAPGLSAWRQKVFDPQMRHTLRIWPHHNDTGGFYVALLQKKSNGPWAGRPVRLAPADQTICGRNEHFQAVENPPALFRLLTERFGIDPAVFREVRLVSKNPKKVNAVASDHRPPPGPDTITGMPFLHLAMRYPKLTTAAAATFGSSATRNMVALGDAQLEAYLSRRSIALDPTQTEACQASGYILLRYRGSVMGVGYYDRQRRLVKSLFPKSLALSGNGDQPRGSLNPVADP